MLASNLLQAQPIWSLGKVLPPTFPCVGKKNQHFVLIAVTILSFFHLAALVRRMVTGCCCCAAGISLSLLKVGYLECHSGQITNAFVFPKN